MDSSQNNFKLLHICSDYSKQKIYKNLVLSLNKNNKSLYQSVFVPTRTIAENYKNNIDNKSRVKIKYEYILNIWDRFFFKRKIKKIYSKVVNSYNINDYNLIHSHFLFSDGAVALKLYQNFKLPYVVSVRNTDMNIFFKYALHLRKKGIEILINSKKIVILTPKYIRQLKAIVGEDKFHLIKDKIVIIPNGIDNFWLKNKSKPKKLKDNKIHSLLYIGDFTKNKNVPYLILLKQKYFKDVTLNIVGSFGADEKQIISLCENDNTLEYYGRINDRVALKEIFQRSDVFCMLSKHETFGLTYIESLSQGVPIIYTKGQGVDGYFSTKIVGYAAEYKSEKSFVDCLDSIAKNYHTLSKNAVELSLKFNWAEISKKYIDLYF